jgi:hypothetical protein
MVGCRALWRLHVPPFLSSCSRAVRHWNFSAPLPFVRASLAGYIVTTGSPLLRTARTGLILQGHCSGVHCRVHIHGLCTSSSPSADLPLMAHVTTDLLQRAKTNRVFTSQHAGFEPDASSNSRPPFSPYECVEFGKPGVPGGAR